MNRIPSQELFADEFFRDGFWIICATISYPPSGFWILRHNVFGRTGPIFDPRFEYRGEIVSTGHQTSDLDSRQIQIGRRRIVPVNEVG